MVLKTKIITGCNVEDVQSKGNNFLSLCSHLSKPEVELHVSVLRQDTAVAYELSDSPNQPLLHYTIFIKYWN